MAVTYTPLPNDTYLHVLVDGGDIKLIPDGLGRYDGKVLRVEDLPPAAQSVKPSTPALLHPQMAEYKSKIEALGYTLVIDTSMNFTGASAYHYAEKRVLALTPTSTWPELEHEFQHAEFEHYLSKDFNHVVRMVEGGASLSSVLPADVLEQLGKGRVRRLEKLMRERDPRAGSE